MFIFGYLQNQYDFMSSNDRILPYGILFLSFNNTNIFYLLPFKLSRYFFKTMAYSFKYQLKETVHNVQS
jgi:hypothetical protein